MLSNRSSLSLSHSNLCSNPFIGLKSDYQMYFIASFGDSSEINLKLGYDFIRDAYVINKNIDQQLFSNQNPLGLTV